MIADTTTYTDWNGETYACSEAHVEWRKWLESLHSQFSERVLNPEMCVLEQRTVSSNKENRCVHGGHPGEVEHRSILIRCVPTYWMCHECNGTHTEELEQ